MNIKNSKEKISYYIDYLRLHRYGKQNKVFRKNRSMLNDEYSKDNKKGYKAYIQRIFRDILLYEIGDVIDANSDVQKPRNFFGYHIGPKNIEETVILHLDRKMHRFAQIIRMNAYMGTDADLIGEYRDKILEGNIESHYSGICLRLSLKYEKKFGAWHKLKQIKQIIEIRRALLNRYENNDDLFIKQMIQKTIQKVAIIPDGTLVKIGENEFARILTFLPEVLKYKMLKPDGKTCYQKYQSIEIASKEEIKEFENFSYNPINRMRDVLREEFNVKDDEEPNSVIFVLAKSFLKREMECPLEIKALENLDFQEYLEAV